MCELFGFSGNTKCNIKRELVEFFAHSVDHPDGWGLAIGSGNGSLNVERESTQAIESKYLGQRLEGRVDTDLALGHIRYATVGKFSRDNCHPFTAVDASGRQWTLIHNGTILKFDALEPFRFQQQGTTDSERVLLYIVAQIDAAAQAKGAALTAQERFEVVDALVAQLSANDNKLNILLFDGELLYAHTNYAHTLHLSRGSAGLLLSTKPLSQGAWEELPLAQLQAYRSGELAFTGNAHGKQSFQTAETIAAWRAAIAGAARKESVA